jgi:5-deoxy-D-glucuronate isomerase
MESTMKKYSERIEQNEISPHIRYDGRKSGLILDPLRKGIPLDVLGFGIYQLKPKFITRETKEKEIVLVPQDGEFEVEVNGKRFSGKRMRGPFSLGSGKSTASVLLILLQNNRKVF